MVPPSPPASGGGMSAVGSLQPSARPAPASSIMKATGVDHSLQARFWSRYRTRQQ